MGQQADAQRRLTAAVPSVCLGFLSVVFPYQPTRVEIAERDELTG